MRIEAYPWQQSQPLTEGYLHQFSRVQELYDYNPGESDDWQRRAEWLDQQGEARADRKQLTDVLNKYNQAMKNAPEAMEAIRLLRDDRAFAVVGGQQAGLFTGPLYVIHKAITLIQTAKLASNRLQRPVVAVFWIAGEDHDFDEVNHTYYLSQQLTVHKIKLEHPTEKRTSVSRLNIPLRHWEEAIQQLDDSLLDTEFKPALLDKLRGISHTSATLVDFFAQAMAWLFGAHGLVLVNSDDPLLRKLEAPMFRRMVSGHRHINEALLSGKAKVERLGYVPQVEIQEGNANLFVFHQGERLLLQADGDGFADKKEQFSIKEADLLDLAGSAPETLSNNVMTRPMMQDYLFPVLCTVLGRSEVAYWGLTGEAFHMMGMRMPLIIPRLEFTLLEGTVQKQMNKYNMSFDDAVKRFDEKKKTWLNEQDTMGLEQKFTQVKARFHELYRPILDTVEAINPGMRKLGETNAQKIMEQIDFLQSRSIDAFQAQFEAATRQLDRIRLSIAPTGKPQERVYNIFAYLNKYGDGWLDELVNTPMDADGNHRIVYF